MGERRCQRASLDAVSRHVTSFVICPKGANSPLGGHEVTEFGMGAVLEYIPDTSLGCDKSQISFFSNFPAYEQSWRHYSTTGVP